MKAAVKMAHAEQHVVKINAIHEVGGVYSYLIMYKMYLHVYSYLIMYKMSK